MLFLIRVITFFTSNLTAGVNLILRIVSHHEEKNLYKYAQVLSSPVMMLADSMCTKACTKEVRTRRLPRNSVGHYCLQSHVRPFFSLQDCTKACTKEVRMRCLTGNISRSLLLAKSCRTLLLTRDLFQRVHMEVRGSIEGTVACKTMSDLLTGTRRSFVVADNALYLTS